jgi:hypothetical protein
MDEGQARAIERVLLDGNEIEPRTTLWIVTPRCPRRQEIQALAETGLDDREGAFALPRARQTVAAQEDVLRLCETTFGAVINVVVLRGERRAV